MNRAYQFASHCGMTRFRQTRAAVGLLLGVVLLLCACSPYGVSTAVPAGQPTVPGEPVPTSPTESGGPAAAAEDPLAPSTYVPVRRSGKQSRERLGANKGGFGAAAQVRYEDGVTIRVMVGPRRPEKGSGPGAFPGRSVTEVTISVSNDSGRTLDLTQVVVTMTYGEPARIASPFYDQGAADFGGTVKPGATATAHYAFAIPDRKVPVVITVDWDESHAPAVFTGKAR